MKKLIVMLFAVAAAFPGQAAAQEFNERIAFDFCRWDFNEQVSCFVYLVSPDASKSAFAGEGTNPAWSPDGSRLFLRGWDPQEETSTGLFVINLGDWSLAGFPRAADTPATSPDGQKVAFSRDGELYVMNANGTNAVQLTHSVGYRGLPAWSRDNATIAFDCEVEGSNRDICAINAGGTGFRRLTVDPAFDSGANYSPDGVTITFVTARFGGYQIAVMSLDGSGVSSVIDGVLGIVRTTSPDGTRIVFVVPFTACDPGTICNDSIYLANRDGTQQRLIGLGDHPTWGVSLRPVAWFLPPAPDCLALDCAFDGSGSWGGNTSIVSYTWNFGDGTTATNSVPTATHHYATGRYTVTLTVTDNAGVTGTQTRDIVVTLPPTARFTSVCSGLQCTFDGSASSDPDGRVVDYAWIFGDGSFSESQIVPQVTHTYPVAGTFRVTLIVRDDHFIERRQEQFVTVSGNVLPVASFTFTCTTLICTFNASGSSDPDGTIASYAWNFGDGTSGSGVTANHTYANGGTLPVILTVTDNAGATNSQTRNVTVVPGTSNRAEQDSAAIQYTGSWYSNSSTGNSGGSAYLALSDATATFSFSGTGVRWLGLKDGWAGIANVYVDGVFNGTVDTYSNTPQYQSVLYTTTGLSAGNHTLKIEATGQKNPSSAQAWIWVDAFEFTGAGGGGGTPDFTVTAGPASASVVQGGSATYTVTVTPANGFNGTVSLSVSGLGAGATASFNLSTISGSGSSTLTVNTTGASQTGLFSLVIAGSSGNLNRSTTVQWTVIAAGPTTTTRVEQDNAAIQYAGTWYSNSSSGNSGGSAFLALNNASATFSFSGTGVRWIGLRDAWAGIANVFVDGVFQGAVDTYTGGSQYQSVLYATTGLSAGPHTLRIEATGQKNPAAAQAWIWVDAIEFTSGGGGGGTPDFTVTASPASASVVQGGSATYTVTVSPANGFNGTVSLSTSGLGAGATASFNPLTISGSGSSTLTVNTTATSQTGPFSLVIAGTSGNLNRSTTVQLTVVAAATTTWTRVEQSDAAIEYTGTWYSNGSSGNSGASAFLALNNASATFSFSGTGVRWIGLRDAWAGIANVYLDGVFQGAVDTYPGTSQYQSVLYEAAGLSAGIHTLRVEATGQKNPASAQAWIWVDAFEFSSAGGSSLPSTSAASGANVQLASVTAGDPTVHIAYLGSEGTQYRNTWTALVTIVVHDTTDRPVPNATVSGVWSLGETASCTTDGSGRCVVSSSTIPRRIQSVTFTIADVTSFMALYREVDNHGPDGDSTSIRVRVKEH